MGLSKKFILFGIILILTFSSFLFIYYYNIKEILLEDRRMATRNLVQTATGIINRYVNLEKNGSLSRQKAQEQARLAIKELRYNRSDYFWINDMNARIVMHPIKPDLDGKDLTNFEDPFGKYIFQEFVNVVKHQGSGYVDYYWPKPGEDAPVAKISYVSGISEWGWVIGTGIYIQDVAEKTLQVFIMIFIPAVLVILFVGIGSFVFLKSTIRQISNVNVSLAKISNEQETLSHNLLKISQSLSENSSRNASSLEDVSASLVEISSLINLNAKSSEKLDELAKNTEQTAAGGDKVLSSIIESINDIKTENHNVEKVTEVVEGIAFQTNLLALNAAVEAARAGEEGKGFSVVAQAVRDLAQKSKMATEDITKIIKSNVEKSTKGAEMAEKSSIHIKDILKSSKNVASLVSEITSATKESASAVNGITKSIHDVDHLTQNNAQVSGEAKDISYQLSNQVGKLRKNAHSLNTIVKGSNNV